ncbi:UDP-N-acetylglucosamine transporter isoform X1 [Lepeophtheirus salmonis]|uniref:UDP-N-acetylglucosamine transporter isoform X1 n=1 Tax=Lepeophtheirus salmonis TaxID=72036 RepID=UPI001AEA1FD5|nr:UDP-N-acetylglucosamine transporter-like isoform X1 [Lepeophtheirus salmonis]
MYTTNSSYTLAIRISVLCLLIVQTSSGVLLMRYSRLYNHYSSTLAVFYSEILKTGLLLILFYKQNQFSVRLTWSAIKKEIIFNPKETIKLIIPGALYLIQNNLVFIALSNLDAATFQITYQLKIITTSLISICILGTRINKNKWVALISLMVGVILVQDGKSTKPTEDSHEKSWAIGLACVLFACISSPFAGVYYEKLIKTGAQCSIVIRNLQLAIFSLTFGFIGVLIQEGTNFFLLGDQFKNFDAVVWAIICIQGAGGIIVAAVVKYTDNIQKGFATSISIVLSSLISYLLLHDLVIDGQFMMGGALVLGSTILYSMSGTKPPKDTAIDSKC